MPIVQGVIRTNIEQKKKTAKPTYDVRKTVAITIADIAYSPDFFTTSTSPLPIPRSTTAETVLRCFSDNQDLFLKFT